MFVVILTYIKPIEFLDALRPKHLEFLDSYFAKNVFIASGRQTPLKGGVILANGIGREELEKIITEDPYHIEKVATYEIFEFTPTKINPNIAKMVIK